MNPSPRTLGGLCLIAGAGLLLHAGCGAGASGDPVYSGTIEAVEVDVVPEVSGLILERPVDQGATVSAGALVARIDPVPYRIALAEVEASLASARSRAEQLRAGYRREEVEAAARDRDEAKAQLAQAEARLARVRRLVEQQVGSADDLDVAQRDRDMATARVASASARHDLLARGYRSEEIAQAAAEVARLEAARDKAALDLARTEVKSPVAGTITEKLQEPGEYARPGNPIVAVADLDRVFTWVYLGEADLGHISLGQKVSVRIDGLPGRDFPGEVVYISKVAEFTPRNVQTREDRQQLVFGVKVAVPNTGGELKVGVPADVLLPGVGQPGSGR